VVTPRPLKLRSQIGKAQPMAPAIHMPVAQVLVDTGVFHLDSPYDYEIPEQYSDIDLVGCRVQVEFGHARHEGLVIGRIAQTQNPGRLKQIEKVLSPHPVATKETIDLIGATAQRWACPAYDVIRSAIPPRVASVDKEMFEIDHTFSIKTFTSITPKALKGESVRSYWMLPPSKDVSLLLTHLILERGKSGQVLIVLPDERTLNLVINHLRDLYTGPVARLDGHHNRSDRYRDYLRMVKGITRIGVGLRGSIFTPLSDAATVIVYEDTSENFYEPRSPGWNTRDVALLRSQISQTNTIIAGFSPSLECARLIETGWLSVTSSPGRMQVLAVEADFGELLPTKIFSTVRKALKSGPVLFLVPRKGYGNAVLCRKCKNISICECGGRLSIAAKTSAPQCVLCLKSYEDWRCAWCQCDEVFVARRGIDRFAEEIGRAFPNFPVINSSGDHMVDLVQPIPSLVLATSGAQPAVEGGYCAVVLLEGMRFFGHTHMRTQESAREVFFATAALVKDGGDIACVIDPVHPIIAALTRWNSAPMIRKELAERADLHLPPFYRYVLIDCPTKEATSLKTGLTMAISEGRIPQGTRAIGPHPHSSEISRLSLAVPVNEADVLIAFLHELQRRRNISRKDLLNMRVDPYSLS